MTGVDSKAGFTGTGSGLTAIMGDDRRSAAMIGDDWHTAAMTGDDLDEGPDGLDRLSCRA